MKTQIFSIENDRANNFEFEFSEVFGEAAIINVREGDFWTKFELDITEEEISQVNEMINNS
jgi:hypothetical protein